ncbi:MAG: DUF2207 domain-containing protein [Candidatus Paceibacterota bacterium]
MKKILLFILTVLLGTGAFVALTKAQSQVLDQETIVSFGSNIVVNTDNSIDVSETIVYNSGPEAHHGIYRDIYPFSSTKKKMKIGNITVTDQAGSPYRFQVTNSGSNVNIKIGDPNVTFLGEKIYLIHYTATNAVAELKDLDEIYWNVTGNGWGMPILNAQASVVLPSGAIASQTACYYGPKGSTNQCSLLSNAGQSYSFAAPSTLSPSQGLTVAVGFPKGIVAAYPPGSTISDFLEIYWPWLVASLLPLLTLILSLIYWYKKGRDPKGTGVIVPQYDVPEELTPMEVGGIVNERVDSRDISPEIIYLATRGYLKINELETRSLGLFKSTDYELVKLKDFSDLPNNFDKELLNALFSARPTKSLFGLGSVLKSIDSIPTASSLADLQSVKLSDLKDVFYQDAKTVTTSVLSALVSKGYYKNLGRMKNGGSGRIVFTIFVAFWASGFFGAMFGGLFLGGNTLPAAVGIFTSIVIYAVISYFSPSKTEKGVLLKEYLLGLKDYLKIAEKDRLIFHNAPEKRPEVFEKLLPYAMILGVANIWAKEFEGIYTTPPSWYSGPNSGAFNAIVFADSMSSFSTFASSSMAAPSSHGGSGGGGSSGGGGGGGGGGGW